MLGLKDRSSDEVRRLHEENRHLRAKVAELQDMVLALRDIRDESAQRHLDEIRLLNEALNDKLARISELEKVVREQKEKLS